MYSKVVLNIIAGIIIWLGCQLFSCISTLISNEFISILLSSVIQIFLTFALLRLYCKKFLNISTADCRIKFILPKPIWFYCAFLLPCAVSAVFFLFVPGSFSLNSLNAMQLLKRILTALVLTCITASLTEEMVFRGFIMKIIETKFGRLWSVLIPSIIFSVFHLIGITPNFFNFIQLTASGISVGIMLSIICYKSDSIVSSTLVHGIWNLIMVGGIINIGIEPNSSAILNYSLNTSSRLLTGGSFGIEASLPAIIGYWCVIIILLLPANKKSY